MSFAQDEDLNLLMRVKHLDPSFSFTPAVRNKLKKAISSGSTRIAIEDGKRVTRSADSNTARTSFDDDVSSYNEIDELKDRIKTMERVMAKTSRNIIDTSGSIMALIRFQYQLDTGNCFNIVRIRFLY